MLGLSVRHTMLGMIKNSLFGSVETWPWQVLSKGSKGDVFYEERACEGGKFATVEVTDKPVDEALREAMPKVMKYVGGSNDKGECPWRMGSGHPGQCCSLTSSMESTGRDPRCLFQCPVTLLFCVGRGALGRPTDVMPVQEH